MAGFDLTFAAHVPESAGFTGAWSDFTPYEEDLLAEYLWNKIIGNPCPGTQAISEISLGGQAPCPLLIPLELFKFGALKNTGYFYILPEAGIEEASVRPCDSGLWKLAGERTVQQQSITVGYAKEWDYHMFGAPLVLQPAFRMTEYRLDPAIVPLEYRRPIFQLLVEKYRVVAIARTSNDQALEIYHTDHHYCVGPQPILPPLAPLGGIGYLPLVQPALTLPQHSLQVQGLHMTLPQPPIQPPAIPVTLPQHSLQVQGLHMTLSQPPLQPPAIPLTLPQPQLETTPLELSRERRPWLLLGRGQAAYSRGVGGQGVETSPLELSRERRPWLLLGPGQAGYSRGVGGQGMETTPFELSRERRPWLLLGRGQAGYSRGVGGQSVETSPLELSRERRPWLLSGRGQAGYSRGVGGQGANQGGNFAGYSSGVGGQSANQGGNFAGYSRGVGGQGVETSPLELSQERRPWLLSGRGRAGYSRGVDGQDANQGGNFAGYSRGVGGRGENQGGVGGRGENQGGNFGGGSAEGGGFAGNLGGGRNIRRRLE